jgi:hypothetical protein
MKTVLTLPLEEQLEIAERDLFCAKMIDNTARMWAEVAECERRVDDVKKQIEIVDRQLRECEEILKTETEISRRREARDEYLRLSAQRYRQP